MSGLLPDVLTLELIADEIRRHYPVRAVYRPGEVGQQPPIAGDFFVAFGAETLGEDPDTWCKWQVTIGHDRDLNVVDGCLHMTTTALAHQGWYSRCNLPEPGVVRQYHAGELVYHEHHYLPANETSTQIDAGRLVYRAVPGWDISQCVRRRATTPPDDVLPILRRHRTERVPQNVWESSLKSGRVAPDGSLRINLVFDGWLLTHTGIDRILRELRRAGSYFGRPAAAQLRDLQTSMSETVLVLG